MLEGVRRLDSFRHGQGIVGEGEGHDVAGAGAVGGSGGRERWKALLGPPGSHRMLYTLQIVDGVLGFVTGCDGDGGGGEGGTGGAVSSEGGGGRREWEVC